MIQPSGWHISKYDFIDNGGYLYNRCHLIGWQLTGRNADKRNLITGTRYMNVEGMPWYDRAAAERQQQEESGGPHYQMTKEEQRMYTWAAVKSGLLVVLIFALVFGAFIAFCDFIWFQ